MKSRVVLLMGDPTGIGPELVVKVLSEPGIRAQADTLVIGDIRIFAMGQKIAHTTLSPHVVHSFEEVQFGEAQLQFLDIPGVSPDEFTLGQQSAQVGKSVLAVLRSALALGRDGRIDAMVYAPLNKKAMRLGGSPFPDELNFFAHELGWRGPYGELNVVDNLWNSRTTSHVGIRQVSELITEQRVYETIALIHHALRMAGVSEPRLAVASLNPHGGEGGLFGSEEAEAIMPAIRRAQTEGIHAEGPFPPDTIFVRARSEAYHAVVSMYHDQGNIALKMMSFGKGICVQGGLPLPITTVQHGVAYDIAGKGVARPEGLRQAFLLAIRMGEAKRASRL